MSGLRKSSREPAPTVQIAGTREGRPLAQPTHRASRRGGRTRAWRASIAGTRWSSSYWRRLPRGANAQGRGRSPSKSPYKRDSERREKRQRRAPDVTASGAAPREDFRRPPRLERLETLDAGPVGRTSAAEGRARLSRGS